LKSLINENTKAILINNPSNPCGSCFSKEHCLEILEVANEYKVPIISYEVYYGLAYGEGSEFYSFGNLTKDVPIIVSPYHPSIFNPLFLFISAAVQYLRFIVYQDGE